MSSGKPWHRSKKVFVLLVMIATFVGALAASALGAFVPGEAITVLAGGVASAATAVAAVQGLEDRERAKRDGQ